MGRIEPSGIRRIFELMATMEDPINLSIGQAHFEAPETVVEAACRAYAEKLGGDPDAWGLVGLLHDFDYERWPTKDDHPYRGVEILAERGYPEWFRRAILSHADYTGVERVSDLEKALFACDELSGFLTACALVTPSRSLHDVKVRSVKKKMKSKAFAASVSRDDIVDGAAGLGVAAGLGTARPISRSRRRTRCAGRLCPATCEVLGASPNRTVEIFTSCGPGESG